jgi:transcriptional regulator with XRE-family HTH domain
MCNMSEQRQAGTIPVWTQGDRLGKALEHSGVRVQEMADHLGVSRFTLSNWIHGKTRPPRSAVMVWALRTGVPLEWLEAGDFLSQPASECAIRDSNPEPAVLWRVRLSDPRRRGVDAA